MTSKIKILYEDPNILVIDKPSGISVHPDGKENKKGEKFITDWVLKNYPKMKNVGEPMRIVGGAEVSEIFPPAPASGTLGVKNIQTLPRPGIVHRLDKDTSGVLILAKNQKAHQFLKEQFQNREVKKVYVTIVSGWVKNDRGVINKPIGRSPNDFRRHLAGRGARGELREAVTDYRVIKRFQNSKGIKFTYLEVRPKTGRTHQIRVHMKYMNHPVVGDELYDPNGLKLKGLERMALHAKLIEFKNMKGDTVKVESKVPKEFETVVK